MADLDNTEKGSDTATSKAWLMTWNPDNWTWNRYSDLASKTKNGEKVVESWTCASKQPQIGDDVFLMKTGEQPRGIVAHGTIARTSYEAPHYDPKKAAEGLTTTHVDVEFDYLLDYEEETIILQDALKNTFSNQEWSPNGSGIAIKEEYVHSLKKWWEEIKAGTFDNSAAYTGLTVDIEKVFNYIKNYSGAKYIKPENAGPRAAEMQQLKESGIEARNEFTKLADIITQFLPGYVAGKCSSWVNQHQDVQPYFWLEIKKKNATNLMHSIAICMNRHIEHDPSGPIALSIRVDLRDKQADDKNDDYKYQNMQIDCPTSLDSKIFFQGEAPDGSNKNYGRNIEEIRQAISLGQIKKLKAVIAIDEPYTNDRINQIIKDLVAAGLKLRPYYEYILSLRGIGTSNDNEYWPSYDEYPVDLTKEDWKRFIHEVEFSHKGCMRVLKCYREIGGIASPKKMSELYKGHANVYTTSITNTSKRALKFFNLQRCPDAVFPIAFLGKSGTGEDSGTYVYKMRDELLQALQDTNLDDIDLEYAIGDEDMVNETFAKNIILYGPPGTGKTYNTMTYAIAIIEGKSLEAVKLEISDNYDEVKSRYEAYKKNGQIAFTTFHQSYGYEDFIEGIRPELNSDNKDIGYTLVDGTFKAFCEAARGTKVEKTDKIAIKDNPRIWGMLLGGTGMTSIKRRCFDNNEIRIGFKEVSDSDLESNLFTDEKATWNAKHMVYDFIYSMEIGDIVVIEKSNKSIDAIGVITGDYYYDDNVKDYMRTRKVEWLVKDIDVDMIQYLPKGRVLLARQSLFAFDYIGMDAISKILNDTTHDSLIEITHNTKPYVFIIDEINRGNISKIFGELITLIEETKREGCKEAASAILPYSNKEFSVPSNVYILGTMNTADRSIALMDTALRRRFSFVEMMPDTKVLDKIGAGMILVNGQELNVSAMLDVINKRIEYLYDREHEIGHAFFTGLKDDNTIEKLASIFQKNVIPLLQEYFYEDYNKIQLVLGDNDKPDANKFIMDTDIEAEDVFKGTPDLDLPEKAYSINKNAFLDIQSYKLIGKGI